MHISVTSGISDLASDMRKITTTTRAHAARIVQHNAIEGNALAKGFASEQHTMFGDADIEYPPSFTSEATTPLRWEYGPDSAIGDGSQAEGYEHGSINSPPHYDMARSADIQGPKFGDDVEDLAANIFWPNS